MGSHASNSSTREVEIGVIWLGGERKRRWKKTAQCSLRFSGESCSLRFGGDRWSLEMHSEDRITSLVRALVEVKELSSGWPLCFTDLQH